MIADPDKTLSELVGAGETDEGATGVAALLEKLGELAAGSEAGPAGQPVQVEFGIASLHEVLADAGAGTDAIDALDVLSSSGETGNAGVAPDSGAGSAGTGGHGHLVIKIVFGDEDSGSGNSM
jgi:hypothetical protein